MRSATIALGALLINFSTPIWAQESPATKTSTDSFPSQGQYGDASGVRQASSTEIQHKFDFEVEGLLKGNDLSFSTKKYPWVRFISEFVVDRSNNVFVKLWNHGHYDNGQELLFLKKIEGLTFKDGAELEIIGKDQDGNSFVCATRSKHRLLKRVVKHMTMNNHWNLTPACHLELVLVKYYNAQRPGRNGKVKNQPMSKLQLVLTIDPSFNKDPSFNNFRDRDLDNFNLVP